MSKLGFPRSTPVPPPAEIKPEPVALHPPLKVPPPEGKPVWIVIVAILVIGLIGGVVWISFASGARTFSGGYAFFPILMVVGYWRCCSAAGSAAAILSRCRGARWTHSCSLHACAR
jgi:hypothetical protein